MRQDIRDRIIELNDKDYKIFSSALIPNCNNMLGIRLPLLRKMAKDIVAKKQWEEVMDEKDVYFEETMLRGMLIGEGTYKEKNVDKAIKYLREFSKYVDNWSVCDSFCASFKICSIDYDAFLPIIEEYVDSNEEFIQRIGYILFMDHYLKIDDNGKKIPRRRVVDLIDVNSDNEYSMGRNIEKLLELLNRPVSSGYYAQMAAAWLTAESFLVVPQVIYEFLHNKENKMDDFTFNKAISKICESKNPSKEIKGKLKEIKRTRGNRI